MNIMQRFYFFPLIVFLLLILTAIPATADTIATISTPVPTEFGTYQPVLVEVTPSVTPYTIREDLSNVANIGNFELSTEVKKRLRSTGFISQASTYRQIYDVYNECEDKGIPAFVTTDACLHTFHILYDYILRALEVNYFIDDLDLITQTMIRDMQAAYEDVTESAVKQAVLDNIAYLSVPYGLLHPEASDHPDISAQEIARIYGDSTGASMMSSDDYPYSLDYSQYKPRGHYTRTPELERYFRAMKWYGDITFSLNLFRATQEGLRHAAIQALLLSRSLATATAENSEPIPISELWDRIYQPTVFFVGKMDDINYLTYLETAEKVFGEDFLSQPPDVLADTLLIDAFITEALKLPDPKIFDFTGKGFRFMGARFTPDSYLFTELTHPDVQFRPMPRGLDVMVILGSVRAYEIIDTIYHDPAMYPGYNDQLNIFKSEFIAYSPEVWAQNLYYNWLYTLVPLLDIKGDGYPPFMQSEAWMDKDLNTALGSWAELRHDTILYVKQSTVGGGYKPIEPPYVMGYVEPNPEVYARLAALADFMRQGLLNRGILDELFENRLLEFENIMLTLEEIAIKELRNITPSREEFAFICNFGGTIEKLIDARYYEDIGIGNETDDVMAVIADVHTDGVFTGECLEVGVGYPLTIHVIAPVNGIPTLTKGSIFSYYEFTQPVASGRLTDEEWQELQCSENAQDMPEWTESFLVGKSSLQVEARNYTANTKQVTFVQEKEPSAFELLQNYPNPFNPSTVINYTLHENGPVRLIVYNIAGQVTEVLVDRWQEQGQYSIEWTPEGLASGIYFVRLLQNKKRATIKVLFMK